MKSIPINMRSLFVMILLIAGMHDAMAQGWVWGRAGTGQGIDAWGVATDPSGNVYAAGWRWSTSGAVDFGSGVTTPPSLVGSLGSVWVKYNNAGVPLWSGGTITTGSGSAVLHNITTDPSGNLLVFGYFTSTTMQIGSITLTNAYPSGTAQYFLAKIDPSGTPLWAVNDGAVSATTDLILLGSDILSNGGLCTDDAGNVYITANFYRATMTIGSTTLTNTGTSSTTDVFVAKYSPAGVLVWATSFGGTNNDYGNSVCVASTGHVFVCGAFSSSSMTVGSTISNPFSRTLAYLAEFSATGTPLWAQASGGSNGAAASGLARDNYGNVYMTGGFCDASITLGGVTLTRTYPLSVPQSALFLVQYSPSHAVTWSKTIGSPTRGVFGFCIAMASCGQVWVSGTYAEAADIDGHTLAVVTDGLSSPDPIFIAGYNLSGGVVGYAGLASGADDQNGIACDPSGNVFMCSDYRYSGVTVGPDVLPPVASPEGFFVAKYANAVVATDTNRMHQDTAFCGSDSLTLRAPAGYVNYYWNDGSSDTILRATTGTYWVFCVTCGDTTLCDTFHVFTSTSDTTYASSDSSVCRSIGSVTLNGPPAHLSYAWSTGATSASIVASANGTYWVRASLGCNMAIDTFHVTIVPDDTTTVSHDTSVCASIGLLTLTTPSGYPVHRWSTGATTSTISVSASGTYYVYSTNVCDTRIDTFDVTFMPVPVVNLGVDTAFCVGNTLTLSSTQPAGSTWLWSTGSTSSAITVTTTGSYSLTVTYSNGCSTSDDINVTISPIPIVDLGPDTAICNGVTPVLQSRVTYSSSAAYLWNTGATTPSITATALGAYWLRVTIGGCPGTDTMVLKNLYDTLNLPMIDTAICRGQYISVRGAGTPGMTYQWTPTAGIANSTLLTTTIKPDTSAMYYIRASISTCPDLIDSFYIDVQPTPVAFAGGNKSVCQFDTLHLHVGVDPRWYTHYQFSWSPATNLDDPTKPDVVLTGGVDTKYYVTVTTPAGCSTEDSASVIVHPGNFATLDSSFSICPHDSVKLLPTGGVSYKWHPGLYLSDSLSSAPWSHAITSIGYTVIATSSFGCLDTVHANVVVRPAATIYLGDSVVLHPGESYQIPTQTNCMYFAWYPPAGLDYNRIASPVASPQISTKYTVHASTEWGCKATDSISIYVDNATLIDLPNAFSPGNGPNGTFKVLKVGIATLNSFRIYNRWGNVVFETTDINEGWDGTYKGKPQPLGVYVYQVEAVTNEGKTFTKKGNVTLLR